jgi:hypothetical protein
MTREQKDLHKEFLDFRSRFRDGEVEFIRLLQETERTKLLSVSKASRIVSTLNSTTKDAAATVGFKSIISGP